MACLCCENAGDSGMVVSEADHSSQGGLVGTKFIRMQLDWEGDTG